MIGREKENDSKFYYVGLNKVSYADQENVHCIVLPPDCIEDDVLNIIDQILIPLGTVTKSIPRYDPSIGKTENIVSTNENTGKKDETKVQHHYSHVLTCINQDTGSKSATDWAVIRVYLGVNLDFNRLLLVHIIPYNKSGLIRKEYSEFCEAFLGILTNAMEKEHVTSTTGPVVDTDKNSRKIPVATTPEEDANNHKLSQFGITNNAASDGTSKGFLSTIVDLGYIRDLQAAYAQKMILRLTAEAQKIDSQTQVMEFRTAKLMTLLKSSYIRAGLTLPLAPEKTSIFSYSLPLTRQTITEPYIADSRLLLLRARRAFKQTQSNKDTKTSPLDNAKEQERQFVVKDLRRQLKEWCVEEHHVRLTRKHAHSRDRQMAIRQYQSNLIMTLHQRFATKEASTRSTTLKDKSFQDSVQNKFSFISMEDPVIVDTLAIYCNRSGALYITRGHLLFYSSGLLLSSLIHVIPLKTVASMSLFDVDTMHAHRTLRYSSSSSSCYSNSSSSSSNVGASNAELSSSDVPSPLPVIGLSSASHLTVLDGDQSDMPMKASSAAVANGNGESIHVVDIGGSETIFEFKSISNSPENPSRVVDLLDLLIRDLQTQAKEQPPSISSRPAVTSTDSLIDFDNTSNQLPTTTTTISITPNTAVATDASAGNAATPAGLVANTKVGNHGNSRSNSNMSTDSARAALYSTDDDYDYIGHTGGDEDADEETDSRRIQDTFSNMDDVISHIDMHEIPPVPDADSDEKALVEFFSPASVSSPLSSSPISSSSSSSSSLSSSSGIAYTDPFADLVISPCMTNDKSFNELSSGEKLTSMMTLLDNMSSAAPSPSAAAAAPTSFSAVPSSDVGAGASIEVGTTTAFDTVRTGDKEVEPVTTTKDIAAVAPKKKRLINIQKFLEESQRKPVPPK